MSATLQGSVGLNGLNSRADVIAAQTLLTRAGMRLGIVDGRCGPKTISAIVHYQRGFLRHPDGLIEPGATTWRHLTGQTSAPRTADATTPIRRVPAVRTPTRTGTPPMAGGFAPAQPVAAPTRATNSSISYRTLLPRPDRSTLNRGLTSPSNQMLLEKFGAPRENYSQQDLPITNERLKRMIVTEHVGPFRATGLKPAVDSLRQVMNDIRAALPTLHNSLSNSGMKVCRLQRGSSSRISNHSWGTAIDIAVGGDLDHYGDNKVQHGLTLMAPYFNARGWYWGAGFRKEDAMHFECSASLIAGFASA
jgi:peptidoglycan hydrolase-like protein with peptidoglycan-binding domain